MTTRSSSSVEHPRARRAASRCQACCSYQPPPPPPPDDELLLELLLPPPLLELLDVGVDTLAAIPLAALTQAALAPAPPERPPLKPVHPGNGLEPPPPERLGEKLVEL